MVFHTSFTDAFPQHSASYRNLLGTAESLIEMDAHIGHVETYLNDLGKKCNAKIMKKSVSNLSILDKSTAAPGASAFFSFRQ